MLQPRSISWLIHSSVVPILPKGYTRERGKQWGEVPRITAQERPCERWDCYEEPWMNHIYAELWADGLKPPWHLPGELFQCLLAHLSFISICCGQLFPIKQIQAIYFEPQEVRWFTVLLALPDNTSNIFIHQIYKTMQWHFERICSSVIAFVCR